MSRHSPSLSSILGHGYDAYDEHVEYDEDEAYEPGTGRKRARHELKSEPESHATSPLRKRIKIKRFDDKPLDDEIQVGTHAKFVNIPIFGSIGGTGDAARLVFRAYKSQCPDWTKNDFEATFRGGNSLVNTEDIIFKPEICKDFDGKGDFQAAGSKIRRGVVRAYFARLTTDATKESDTDKTLVHVEDEENDTVPLPASNRVELRVGSHAKHGIPVFALMTYRNNRETSNAEEKSPYVYFQIHREDIASNLIPKISVPVDDILFEPKYDQGNNMQTKLTISNLLGQMMSDGKLIVLDLT